MSEFARLVRRQVERDVRRLPAIVRSRVSETGRAERCGTVAEVRAAARRALPRVLFDFIDGAAGDEITARRNQRDLAAVGLVPRALAGAAEVDLSTTVLGRPVRVPLIGAPMGLLGLLHPDGEAAVARALHREGSPTVLSAMASCSIEEVAAAAPGPVWFQLYVWRDRGLVRELMDRARAAGHEALVLTVDVPVAGPRDRDRRNGFGLPPRLTLRSLAGGAVRPRWSARFVRAPRMVAGNAAGRGGGADDPVGMAQYINAQFDPAVTWADLAVLREQWDGPLLVKGVLGAADAREALRRGADGVIVSNHGGRQLDGAPSTISVLPEIADAVGDAAEVYMDGGIRRGSDVMKALAAGARACLVGRPLAFGLGVAGEAGAARVAAILRDELRTALALAGCPSVRVLDRSWIRRPTPSEPS